MDVFQPDPGQLKDDVFQAHGVLDGVQVVHFQLTGFLVHELGRFQKDLVGTGFLAGLAVVDQGFQGRFFHFVTGFGQDLQPVFLGTLFNEFALGFQGEVQVVVRHFHHPQAQVLHFFEDVVGNVHAVGVEGVFHLNAAGEGFNPVFAVEFHLFADDLLGQGGDHGGGQFGQVHKVSGDLHAVFLLVEAAAQVGEHGHAGVAGFGGRGGYFQSA